MWRAVVYILCALLAISSCAKKKQGVSCANPDPTTGACLREETTVSDPDDTAAILERALQSQEAAQKEIARLQKEKADLEAQISSGERPASDETGVDKIAETIITITDQAEKRGYLFSSKIVVDTSKVPGVTLTLKNVKKMGMRPEFKFTHVTGLSDIKLHYGGEGDTQVFNFGEMRTNKAMELSSVKIPVELRFKFNDTQHCATAEIGSDYEGGRQAMTVGAC